MVERFASNDSSSPRSPTAITEFKEEMPRGLLYKLFDPNNVGEQSVPTTNAFNGDFLRQAPADVFNLSQWYAG
jgi:hypothetical protein